MAIGNPADIGYGLSITFSSTFFAQITDFSASGYSRSVVDVSSNASPNGYRIFLPGDLKDTGEFQVEINFLTNNLTGLKAAMAASKESGVITYPVPVDGGGTAGTITSDMFASNFDHAAPMDDRMTASVTVKLSGVPAMANAT